MFSIHGEGERMILRNEEGEREEVDLVRPLRAEIPEAHTVDGSPIPADEREPEEEPAPGTSALDRLAGLWKGVRNDSEE